MKFRSLTPILAICACTLAGQAVAESPPRDLNEKVTWLRKPGPGDLDALYPPMARARNLGGWALMRCRVNVQGRMQECRIAAEAPAGAGFGAMALKLSKNFQTAPTTIDGSSVDGGYLTIPVTLTGNGAAVIPDKTYLPAEPVLMLTAPTETGSAPSSQPCSTIDLSQGRCGMHRLKWAEALDPSEVAPIIRKASQTTGKTALTCIVGDAGALGDCQVVGDVPPGSRLAMLEIANRLHAKQHTDDGLAVAGQRILALFDWTAMTNTYDVLFPPQPTP